MALADGTGTPLGIHVQKASPADVKWLEPTLEHGRIGGRRAKHRQPKRLIADRGYDSNNVRALLVKRDIEPSMPARSHHRVATHQDGRKPRRYKHRWIIERTDPWWQNFR
jgi:transposase